MKFIHLADLHIGKKLNGYSLIEDQKYIFDQILEESKKFSPDAFFIAGDVFDRSLPAEEAVKLFDWFILNLKEIAPVFIISGNHDSGTRLELFKEPLKRSDIYIVGNYNGKLEYVDMELENEDVRIHLLPYISPADMRVFTEEPLTGFEEAVKEAVSTKELKKESLNILLAHQFFLNHVGEYESLQEGSERPIIGGLDDVHVSVVDDFDYVALGHIHGMKNMKDERVRYPGTPLKYSVGEHTKYLNCVELTKEKVKIEPIELKPLRDVREIKGNFNELIKSDRTEDYVTIDLLDKKSIPNVKSRLLKVFPNLLNIRFNIFNEETEIEANEKLIKNDPVRLLEDFFKSSGQKLDESEKSIVTDLFNELKESSN